MKTLIAAIIATTAALVADVPASAQFYAIDPNIGSSQTNLSFAPGPPGYTEWISTQAVTNFGSAPEHVYFAFDATDQTFSSVESNVTPGVWSQPDLDFTSTDGSISFPLADLYVPTTDLLFSLPAQSDFAPGDTVPFIDMGEIGGGLTMDVNIDQYISNGTGWAFYQGQFVTAAPEPASAPLAGLGICCGAMIAATGRRRRRIVGNSLA